MNIAINALRIRNFKGIRDFTLAPGGKNISVYGGNATGKTTIFDAFLWLLLGKDSQGRADFEIKPLDERGNETHGVDIEVSAELSIDGAARTLKKVQRESWIKQKGRAEAVFSGNETSCEIDGIPKKIGEYQKFCAELAEADTLKLLTSTTAFNALNAIEKRAALLKICGANADIPCAGKYARLPEILLRATPQEAKKRLKSKRDELNRELNQLPARIDEASAAIVEASPEERREAEYNINDIQSDIASIDRQVAELQASDPSVAAERKKTRLDGELELERRKRRIDRLTALSDADSALTAANRELERIKFDVELAQNAKDNLEAESVAKSAEIAALRDEWRAIRSRRFDPVAVSDACPTCGQRIPAEQRAKALETAETQFCTARKAREDAANAKGKAAREQLDKLTAQIGRLDAAIAAAQKRIDAAKSAVDARQKEQARIKSLPDEPTARETELVKQLDALRADSISDGDVNARVAEFQSRRADLEARRTKHQRNLYAWEQSDKATQRVADLTARQKELGAQVAQTDLDIMLIDDYVTATCEKLEERVNGLFDTVHWKLFDYYDNGAYRDACVCTVGGVPYGSLNNAARINAGLEIINVMSAFYGVRMPIFIDNAESINELIQTESQQIRLVVSHDNELTIREDERQWKTA